MPNPEGSDDRIMFNRKACGPSGGERTGQGESRMSRNVVGVAYSENG
jgi:hypothetical protein